MRPKIMFGYSEQDVKNIKFPYLKTILWTFLSNLLMQMLWTYTWKQSTTRGVGMIFCMLGQK